MSDDNRVTIYTDGACSGNPGPEAGVPSCASVRMKRNSRAAKAETTNNRMELTAAIEALNALKRPCAIDLYTDSTYVRSGIREWLAWLETQELAHSPQNKPVKNADLWQALDAARERHDVTWHWVKGHAGHPDNERADELARGGMAPYKGGE